MGDFRYAARSLLTARGFSATAILILALAIAGNTAAFSAVDVLLLDPLPFADAGRLVVISGRHPATGARTGVSYATYEAWARHAAALDGAAAVQLEQRFNLSGGPDPIRVTGARMTASLLPLLGVSPLRGRLLLPADEQPGAPPVVLITERFWTTRFQRAEAAVGSTVVVDGAPATIVGVLPAQFKLLYGGYALWVPLSRRSPTPAASERSLMVIARRNRDAPVERCAVELSAIAEGVERERGTNRGVRRARVLTMREFLLAGRQPTLIFVLVALALLLLVACANIASLQLARATVRQPEIATRLALGASRWRVIRELLAEALLIAGAAAALALGLVAGTRRLLLASSPDLRELTISLPVLAFTLALTLVTAVVFGLVPALTGTRMDLSAVLKGAFPRRRSTRRLLSALVVVELTSSLVLLVPAGLLFKSFLALRQTDPGFDANGILTFSVALPAGEYVAAQQRRDVCEQAIARLAALPGVRSVAASDALPLESPPAADVDAVLAPAPDGTTDGGRTIRAVVRTVSPDYFRAFGIALRAGRPFSGADAAQAAGVAIVNETFAAAMQSDRGVLGQHVRIRGAGDATIVGVAADVRSVGLRVPPQPEVMIPLSQHARREMAFAIAAGGDGFEQVAPVRRVMQAIDPDIPLASVRPMAAILDEQVTAVRVIAALLAVLAAIALVLAAAGLSGLMARLVAQRTHEIGIRAALGATRRDVVLLVMRDAAALVAWGIALGLPLAALAARLVSGAVWGVRAVDVPTFAVVPLVLIAATCAACYVPARRAARLDPAGALRAH